MLWLMLHSMTIRREDSGACWLWLLHFNCSLWVRHLKASLPPSYSHINCPGSAVTCPLRFCEIFLSPPPTLADPWPWLRAWWAARLEGAAGMGLRSGANIAAPGVSCLLESV